MEKVFKSTTEIETPCVAVVHFKNDEVVELAGRRLIYYQVTIDPINDQQLSPSGDLIRFGDVQGDEITGWQLCANIVIDEILFEYQLQDRMESDTDFSHRCIVDDKDESSEKRRLTATYSIPYLFNTVKVKAA